MTITKKEEKEEEQQQQQKEKDGIIDYNILDHQEELLDEKYIPIIRSAMRRMPLDVLETIADDRNIRFLTITDQFYAVVKNLHDPYGAYPSEERRDMPFPDWQLVIINGMMMDKLSLEDKRCVIAHELAHVYLKHDSGTPSNEEGKKDDEQEADDLIRSWGFDSKTYSELRLQTQRIDGEV